MSIALNSPCTYNVGLIFCYVMRWCSYICKCIKWKTSHFAPQKKKWICFIQN